jgi:hypothetical protein
MVTLLLNTFFARLQVARERTGLGLSFEGERRSRRTKTDAHRGNLSFIVSNTLPIPLRILECLIPPRVGGGRRTPTASSWKSNPEVSVQIFDRSPGVLDVAVTPPWTRAGRGKGINPSVCVRVCVCMCVCTRLMPSAPRHHGSLCMSCMHVRMMYHADRASYEVCTHTHLS